MLAYLVVFGGFALLALFAVGFISWTGWDWWRNRRRNRVPAGRSYA